MITLTNNRYRVQLCDDGCGLSQCDWLALNRWTEHSLSGPRGFFIYLRDAASHRVWSATPAPCFARGAHYEARQAGWGCACDGIRSDLSVLVEPAQNSETRTLVLTNDSPAPRTIEVTSFLEVVLHDPRADAGHPAFAKLFVQTGRHGASGALVAMRRPRANNEQWPCMVHALSGAPARTWATDRMGFIGRGRDARRPAALRPGARLACTSGNVLDACMSLRACVTLQPGERRVLRFHLGMAADQIEAIRWALAWCRDTDQGDTCTPGNPPAEAADSAAMADLARDLQFFNGHGGFSRDGDAHVILMPWAGDGPLLPPMPWVNVIGHETFGVLISEKGAACTWSRCSATCRSRSAAAAPRA